MSVVGCDESCNESRAWYDRSDAWQWDGQVAVAVVGVVVLFVAARFGFKARFGAATVAAATAVATFVLWYLAFVEPAGY